MSTFAQIETLKQQLAQVKSDLAESKSQKLQVYRTLVGSKLRSLYYQAALALRIPAPNYSMWDAGVLTIGPVIATIVAFIIFFILSLPGGLVFWLLLLVAIVTYAVLNLMLKYPSTAELPKLIADQRSMIEELRKKISQIRLESSTLQKQLVATRSAMDELVEADRLKREALLAKNWKAMLEDSWRQFVEEVFLALGGEVQNIEEPTGADMTVLFGDIRIAVLTKANVAAVTSKDIQQVLAAKSKLNCDRVAIITNHRFARSAEELAVANSVYLIGMQEVPSFVMGSNLELLK